MVVDKVRAVLKKGGGGASQQVWDSFKHGSSSSSHAEGGCNKCYPVFGGVGGGTVLD